MSVGDQITKAYIDSQLTAMAVGLRNLGFKATNMMTQLGAEGDQVAALVAAGYDNTPNAANPDGISDAELADRFIGYMSTLAGIYYGRVQQGGTGGTGASVFNFDNALSPLWGPNIG